MRAAAKVMPTSGLTFTWLMPLKLNSTGSSAVRILMSSLLSELSAEYRVTVLPEPVGPVTSSSPCGRLRQRLSEAKVSGVKPSLVRSTLSDSLSRIRRTMPSPCSSGRVDTRKSTARLRPRRILMRPSWGTRRSVMFSPARIFMRAAMAFLMVSGRFMDLNREPSLR